MRYSQPILIACSISLVACVTGPRPNTVSTLSGPTEDRVWFTGASNIRHFTCSAKQVNVSAEAAPENFQRTRSDGVTAVRSAALEVPVRSLDCGIGLQNAHLFQTLEASKHPSITFVLGNYSIDTAGADAKVTMDGRLQIAGVEKNVALQGRVVRTADGQMMLSGDREIDVGDFGVKPPRRFFGLFRVRKEITVHFVVTVRPLIDPLGILAASLP